MMSGTAVSNEAGLSDQVEDLINAFYLNDDAVESVISGY